MTRGNFGVSLLLQLLLSGSLLAQTADPPAPQSGDAGTADTAQTRDRATPGVAASSSSSSSAGQSARERVFYPDDTEKLKPLAHKVLYNFALDQKEIWSSPFRMNRHNAKWWLLFGGATGALIASDHYIENRIDHSPSQINTGTRLSYLGEEYTLIPAAVGLYAYGVWKDDAKPREVGVLTGQALLDDLVVMQVMKLAFGRQRPDAKNVRERSEWFSGGQSFPSGHAMASWTIASVLTHEYAHTPGAKWVPWVACGFAGTVTVARWMAAEHFSSDLLAGAAVGWFIGRYVYKTHEDMAIHRHQSLSAVNVVPDVAPETRTYGIALNFGGSGAAAARPLTMATPIPVGGRSY